MPDLQNRSEEGNFKLRLFSKRCYAESKNYFTPHLSVVFCGDDTRAAIITNNGF